MQQFSPERRQGPEGEKWQSSVRKLCHPRLSADRIRRDNELLNT